MKLSQEEILNKAGIFRYGSPSIPFSSFHVSLDLQNLSVSRILFRENFTALFIF